MKRWIKCCARLLAAVLLCAFFSIAAAAAPEKNELTVAFCPLEGFFEYDSSGKECGYGVDYLEEISRQSGLHFSYFPVESWEDCFALLKSGKVDLVLPVSRASKENSSYHYASEPILYSFQAVMTRADRSDLYYNDFETMGKLKIALTPAVLKNQSVDCYFEGVGIAPELIVYDTYLECKQALDAGEVDALVSNIMDYEDSMKLLARFNPSDNYIVMREGDSAQEKINEAIYAIKLESPSFQADLYQHYYPERNIVPYTREELRFVEEHQVLRVAMHPQSRPMAYYDTGKAEYRGIAVESIQLLGNETGLQFEIVEIPASESLTDAVAAGKAELMFPGHLPGAEEPDTQFSTAALIKLDVVFVAQHGTVLDPQSRLEVGVERSDESVRTALLHSGRNIQVKTYASEMECLMAHQRGEVDAIAEDVYTMGYLLQNPHYEQLRILPTLSFGTTLCLTGPADLEEPLLSLLNKGITRLDAEKMESIINRYTVLEHYDETLEDAIYRNRATYLVIALFLFLAGIGFMLYTKTKAKFYRALEKKNEELKKAGDAKGEFLSNVSHDMRTPMNAVIGLSELAMQETDNPQQMLDYIRQINSSGHYLLELINDVLDMSKIESNKLTLQIEKVSVEELFGEINMILAPQLAEKNLTYHFEVIGFTSKYAMLDKLRIKQIFLNLLSNAIKFTPPGGEITCHIENLRVSGSCAFDRITIRDTGIGMSEEFLPRLFQPFEQEHSEKNLNYGTGLGLTIVKSLVEMMGGTITVKSRKGEGTEFVIELQTELAEESPLQPPRAEETSYTLEGKRVLLCEDHPLNVQIAVRMLEKKGILVETAPNGQRGTELFAASREGYYDAVLMDIRMPVMDGLEATRVIRGMQRQDAKTVPIIAMTANAFEDDREKSREAGMNAHLAKPIEPRLFYETLSRLMS